VLYLGYAEGGVDFRSNCQQGVATFHGKRLPEMAFEDEAGCVRRVARRGTVFFTRHAEEERRKDNIEKVEIANILGRCVVTHVEVNKKNGEAEWRAEAKDSDGRRITVVVVVYENVGEIKVITTWANK
jgi:hypothetical protein